MRLGPTLPQFPYNSVSRFEPRLRFEKHCKLFERTPNKSRETALNVYEIKERAMNKLLIIALTLGCLVTRAYGEEQPSPAYKIWPSEPPADCPFPKSTEITGVAFTGKFAHYNDDNKDLASMIGDTWYPSWAADGNLYSPWTDGFSEWR